MEEVARVARRAAFEAGNLLKTAWQRSKQVEYKSEVELVTEIDRQAESIIIGWLQREFPEHSVVAEESEAIVGSADWTWYVDPLDGTTNFAHGYPQFAVSIALFKGREAFFALVYDPLREELFTARRDAGALLNGNRIGVSPTATLNESLLATGFPYDRRRDPDYYLRFFRSFLVAAQGIRRAGAAALDLCQLACGRLDGFWEFKLKPWDTAAGSMIVREAGGEVSDFSGTEFDPHGSETLASNGHIHQEMIALLGPLVKNVEGHAE